jgi:N-acetyl-alpha-D-glucosaminyl L-malate synthase BshA
MKIGIVCYASLGGSGIVATEIGLELARRGHEVHFIASEKPWRFSDAVGKVFFHQVPEHAAPGDTYTLAVAATIAQVAPALDVLHLHYAVPHAAAAVLALPAARPVIVNTLHGTDVTRAFAPVLRRVIEFGDGVTVPSHFLAASAKELLQLRVQPQVIANFVDTERFKPATERAPATLLHASNFRAVKRTADVVAIFAEVRKTHACKLLLAGDGDERASTEALARPYGDDVTFLGARKDMAALLQTARVFLLTSSAESFGLAALEAQSSGVPVVGTTVGGVSEVVKSGETGFLSPVGDIQAMAASVKRLLDDEALYSGMAKRAREQAVARFDKAKQVDAYEAYFSSLVSSRAPRL